jgi:hypothetical protein
LVSKHDLGETGDQGWRAMSNPKDELAPYLPTKQVAENNRGTGQYRLLPSIEVAGIDLDRLDANGDVRVRKLAAEIRRLQRT